MRYIVKRPDNEAALCLHEFVGIQMQARQEGTSWEVVRVDYPHLGRRTGHLRDYLIKEQQGLCAYTGFRLDAASLAAHQPPTRAESPHSYQPHIEHLKPQSQCREELAARGGVVGRDVGDDIAYENLVAALEVKGNRKEWFGASFRGDKPVAILPTNPECVRAFVYWGNGDITAVGESAQSTLSNLNLNHPTLRDWRRGAIQAFLEDALAVSDFELETLLQKLNADSGILPEFAFAIADVAKTEMELRRHRQQAQNPIVGHPLPN